MRIELNTISACIARWFVGPVIIGLSQISFAHGGEGVDQSHETPAATVSTPADPRAVAEAFNRALALGDGDSARALLAPEVLIFESGGAESSAAEYAGHHMPADMAFLADLKREQYSQQNGGDGKNAWVATRSRLTGRFNGEDVDMDSTETLVMLKMDVGWRIRHIHWSSVPHRVPKP